MEIYVVQQGDTIASIAEKFNVDINRLVYDNELNYPYHLLVGQALVIAYPKQVHLVQEGDTLQAIADQYQVTVMQLLRNNSFLSDRRYIYPGETLVISYQTEGSITTNGYTYTFIKDSTLVKVLPNLTYLSIFNYRVSEEGGVEAYGDDTELVKTAIEYKVIPLLMMTTLTPQGQPNAEIAFNHLLNEDYQEKSAQHFIQVMKSKGYRGMNVILNYLSKGSKTLYLNYIRFLSKRLKDEGFSLFLTINYSFLSGNLDTIVEGIDIDGFSTYVEGISYLKFVWGTNDGPPAPVVNINFLKALIDRTVPEEQKNKLVAGIPILGYDWMLPYQPGQSSASSLSVNGVMELAKEAGAVIQYDLLSQTPYFYYEQYIGTPVQHVVWYVDARSIEEVNHIIMQGTFQGSGIWSIMFYYTPLWTSINSHFDIIKLL